MLPTKNTGNDAATAGFDEGGATLNRPSGVHCPACRTEMEIGEVQTSQFVGCPACKGTLFQRSVFATLIRNLRMESTLPPVIPAPLNPDDLKIRRVCPTCENVLETHSYGGPGNSVIDSCFPCGVVFFDHGELSKLVRAPGAVAIP